MLSRDDLYFRLNYLVPNAKFAFWPHENKPDNKGYEVPFTIVDYQDFRIVWYPENINPIPSLSEILAVTDEQIESFNLQKHKEARDERYKKNLGIVALYQTYKQTYPDASFSDYLDTIEEFLDNGF